jgi:replicative DNA helicase
MTQDVTTASAAPSYAQAVSDAALVRRIKQAGLGMNTREGMSAPELLMYATKAFDEAITRRQTPELREMGEALGKLLDRVESGQFVQGYPTGHRQLDDVLGGGLVPGRLYTVAASPGVGKSAFLTEVAISIARQNHRVLIVSLEMDTDEVTARILSQSTAISWSKLVANRADMNDWRIIGENQDDVAGMPITILDAPESTVADITSHANHLGRDGLGLVVVDYVQLMGDPASSNRTNEIGAITSKLKRLAKKLKVPVVMASQLNREKDESMRPTLRRLRDSGAIEQDSDVVLFIHPLFKDLGQGRTEVELIVAKNRHGLAHRTINMAFTPATTTFQEV